MQMTKPIIGMMRQYFGKKLRKATTNGAETYIKPAAMVPTFVSPEVLMNAGCS